MLFERIYEEGLAQASYFIGCQRKGQAIVVDARRDIQVYLDLAAKNGMDIIAVTETHIHADYLSGTRELASSTGATVYLSGEGGTDWQYDFDGTRIHHGDTIQLGNITLTAQHTPGHTPEHLSFLVTDGAVADQPGYMLTGDFVFVGDLGRPDLLDEAAGGKDTRFAGAKDLFASLKRVFMPLPDYVQIYPAHGAGSPCGKALGAVPTSTVGYQKAFAWWAPYLENDDEQGFIDELLDGQPDAHAYFARMKKENRLGPALIGQPAHPEKLDVEQVKNMLSEGSALLVDTRDQHSVHRGTVKGALNVPAGDQASNFAAWVIDPEREQRPLIVTFDGEANAAQFRDALYRVGIDTVRFFTSDIAELANYQPETIVPADLDHTGYDALVDVRGKGEYAAGSIPGAQQLSGGSALWRLNELPQTGSTLVTFCQSGVRNSVVASGLRRAGYKVLELEGSYQGWLDEQGA